MMRNPTIGDCRRCQRRRALVARRLCSACYGWLHVRGALDEEEYPTIDRFDLPPVSVYCDCDEFVAEAIPLFLAVQCATCKRPERPAP